MKEGIIELMGAIIRQAVGDLELKETTAANRLNKRSAEIFLSGERLEYYCGLCGLDAAYIRKKILENRKKPALLTKDASKNA